MYTLDLGDRRLHYLAMPRTASKATRDALMKIGFEQRGSHHTIEEIHPDDAVITTVRNHWDWFVSFWFLNQQPTKFHKFVRTTINHSEWIRRGELYWQYAPLATHLLRYETLQRDFNNMASLCGLPLTWLQQNGPKKPRAYQTFYRHETRVLVHQTFKDEIDHYGYTF